MKAASHTKLACAMTLCAAIAPITVAEAQRPLNRIVATVENEAITELELAQGIERAARMLNRQNLEVPDRRILAQQVLQQMIVRQLQLQEAKKHNIAIDEVALDRAIEAMAESKNLSLDAFEQSFRGRGEDYQTFRHNLRDDLTIRSLIQREVIDRIQVSEKEIKDELASNGIEGTGGEHRFAQIRVVPDSPDVAEAAKKRLLQIRRQLRGKSFSSFDAFAKRFSRLWKAASEKDAAADLAYRIKDLRWRRTEELPQPVSRRIDSLRSDNVSPIVSSGNSLYLFQRLASRGDGQVLMQRQYRVRHILIPTTLVDGDDKIRKRLIAIKRKLEDGADFAKLACAYSHDPLSSAQGGDLGWSDLQGFVPEFAEAARRAYATGDLVGPFKTAYGWHILEVTGSREENVANDTLRQQAIAKIRQRKSQESVRLWLLGLRGKSRVEVRI